MPLEEKSLGRGAAPRRKKIHLQLFVNVNNDALVFKYPQDVHSGEAKIYSPEET